MQQHEMLNVDNAKIRLEDLPTHKQRGVRNAVVNGSKCCNTADIIDYDVLGATLGLDVYLLSVVRHSC